MAQIVPAILEKTKEGFKDAANRVIKLPGLERIQVDFGDGIFIENHLLDASDLDTLNPVFHWEAHLMVNEPNDFFDYQICGFKTIIVHYEAFTPVENLKKTLSDIKSMGFKTGVAINPGTPVDALKGIFADQYLIMGVVPGKQGQMFIPSTVEKIRGLRKLLPSAIIEVDGGINETNIKSVKEAGADLICAGSSLVKAADINQAYEKLKETISA